MAKTKWVLDNTHSEIQFKVKHLMISTVSGSFNDFTATVTTEADDFNTAQVEFSASIDSISTNNEQRDAHLKAPDFFDSANHPKLVFKSTKLEKIADDEYTLSGMLTLKGESKPITLRAEFGGIIQDPWGHTRAGFELSGKINRKDFGISFGMVSETGGLVLGDEVKIHANVEFVKEAAAVTA